MRACSLLIPKRSLAHPNPYARAPVESRMPRHARVIPPGFLADVGVRLPSHAFGCFPGFALSLLPQIPLYIHCFAPCSFCACSTHIPTLPLPSFLVYASAYFMIGLVITKNVFLDTRTARDFTHRHVHGPRQDSRDPQSFA